MLIARDILDQLGRYSRKQKIFHITEISIIIYDLWKNIKKVYFSLEKKDTAFLLKSKFL